MTWRQVPIAGAQHSQPTSSWQQAIFVTDAAGAPLPQPRSCADLTTNPDPANRPNGTSVIYAGGKPVQVHSSALHCTADICSASGMALSPWVSPPPKTTKLPQWLAVGFQRAERHTPVV